MIKRRFSARMRRYAARTVLALPAAAISLFFSSAPALADLKLCNRMSYVVEAAIGIDDKSATATRGWFRIDPAACRVVAQGTLTADRYLLNARALRPPAQDLAPVRARGRQGRAQRRLVPDGSRQVPAPRRHGPAETDIQLCRSRRR